MSLVGTLPARLIVSWTSFSMHDRDIRKALHQFLQDAHVGESGTLIINELGLCQGDARADLAVINGSLNGYEIKSERDTLIRLPRQRDIYGQCFNTMTIVASKKHISKARVLLPKWWGILEAKPNNDGAVIFIWRRIPKNNREIKPESVVKFLWKKEGIAILTELGVDTARHGKTRRDIAAKLVELLTVDQLCEAVREQIKVRGDWRVDSSQTQRDDSRRSAATSSRSQEYRSWLLSLGSSDLHC